MFVWFVRFVDRLFLPPCAAPLPLRDNPHSGYGSSALTAEDDGVVRDGLKIDTI